MPENGFSVIVVCNSREKSAIKCMQSVENQVDIQHVNLEILIVTKDGNDPLCLYAHERLDSKIKVEIIEVDPASNQSLLLTGIRKAKYDLIGLINSNNLMGTNWISEVIYFMQSHPGCGVCGGENSAYFLIEPVHMIHSFLNHLEVGKQGLDPVEDITNARGYVWGSGMGIRKAILQLDVPTKFQVSTKTAYHHETFQEDCKWLCQLAISNGYLVYYNTEMKTQVVLSPIKISWVYMQILNRRQGAISVWVDFYKDLIIAGKKKKAPYSRLVKAYFKTLKTLLSSFVLYLLSRKEKIYNADFLKIQFQLGRLSELKLFHLRANAGKLSEMHSTINIEQKKAIEPKQMMILN